MKINATIEKIQYEAMTKSPLRYPGGKSRAVEKIASLVPDFSEYREPFLGGGSVFLYLKQKYHTQQFWINDLYPELYYFWKKCQTDIQTLITQVNMWKETYQNGKELHRFLIDNMPNFDETQKASAFFVCNRITFSGTTEAGGFSQQAYNDRFTLSSVERLIPFAKQLSNTQITNVDYSELLTKEGKNVFLFLDPPYFSATKSALYGKNGKLHKAFDHERLAESLQKCSHKWLITYDDSDYIRNLFSFAEINAWNLTYGMRNITKKSNQKGEELFISNYPIFETQKAAMRLFAEPQVPYIIQKPE
ncbi:MAG: DNA adenine methylase [Chitinophagales bacterium]|nr:DNA adenine methylase [Chitinophagales bacterium]HNL06177.1 DNA adenine methylase [Chitinophagales bacterium]